MTKEFFVENVLLRINGGKLTDESSVKRRDIKAYLPAAVNYVMEAGYNINLQSEGNRDISSLFYGYFPDVVILKDANRHGWSYIEYPKPTIALRSNQGIRSIEDGCGDTYKPLSDNALRTINHYKGILTGSKYYRPEAKGIYLFNHLPTAKTVNLVMVVDSGALADDDLLPIPAGLETKAIDICIEFMTGQRSMPTDPKNDKKDIN